MKDLCQVIPSPLIHILPVFFVLLFFLFRSVSLFFPPPFLFRFYPILIQLKTVDTILSLLMHENADIALAVVALLQELTDGDRQVFTFRSTSIS
jgi:hypothetical protein